MKEILIYFAILGLVLRSGVECLDNGLALTPPMGWMSWQRYRCELNCEDYPTECVNERLYTRMADVMVEQGYRDAGYEYVIIDDCWMESERNETGHLVADRIRFPRGIPYVADYIHKKGLKFGLYEDYGTKTCEGYPGVIGYMEKDANTFAAWGVDYVKLDGCNADVRDLDSGYIQFGRYLNATGRPMVYSCSWPYYIEISGVMPNYELLKEHCNLWRNWHDVQDSWRSVQVITQYYGNFQDRVQPHSGPGHWNDPDMLVIGDFALSLDQSKQQMAVWAILAAPLIMSNDLRAVRPEFKEILLNKEIIAVNQDPLGIQGLRLSFENNIEVWARPILPSANSGTYMSYAVAFGSHRTNGLPFLMDVPLETLGLHASMNYRLTDLYDSTKPAVIVSGSDGIRIRVNPSGVVFYKFVVIEEEEPTEPTDPPTEPTDPPTDSPIEPTEEATD